MNKSDQFWDKKAEGYSQSPIADEENYQRKLFETQKLFSSDMRILEFGCGTGTTAIEHSPYVQHIDALDISEKMLEIGRRQAIEANVDNINFTRSTLTEFNATSESLDAVLGLNVIHLLPNRQEILAEVARILKPGGIFISSTGCLGNSYLRFLKLLVPIGKLFGLMPDVFIMSEAQLIDEIERAGFTIETQWHHGMDDISVFVIARKKHHN